jgi:hypothetical protein
VHHQAEFVPLKVDAIVAQPEPVQRSTASLQLSEAFKITLQDFLGQAAELTEDFELKFLGHAGELGGTGGIEDDLEGSHSCGSCRVW